MKLMRKLMKPMRMELFHNIRVNTDVPMELFIEEKEHLTVVSTTIETGGICGKKKKPFFKGFFLLYIFKSFCKMRYYYLDEAEPRLSEFKLHFKLHNARLQYDFHWTSGTKIPYLNCLNCTLRYYSAKCVYAVVHMDEFKLHIAILRHAEFSFFCGYAFFIFNKNHFKCLFLLNLQNLPVFFVKSAFYGNLQKT